MITFTLSTTTNLFGRQKPIVEILEKNPWYIRHLMERSSSIVLDYELSKRIMWMYPKGTHKDVDVILELNESRLAARNRAADERIGFRRGRVFACDGERIKFNHAKYARS